MSSEFRVHFPLSVLKSDQSLLDPNNTETVWEYYLLENLSCGLVRDSKASPSGYEGCIAERFYQESPEKWTFQLRSLYWSDGSKVLESEIKFWIDSLRSEEKRHIKILKHALSVVYEEEERLLKLHFPFPVGNEVIHEFSLADAGFFPKDFKSHGWGKTIGPYVVTEWSSERLNLRLKANPYSPLFRKEMPDSVELFLLNDLKERALLFSRIPVDVLPVSPLAAPSVVNEVIKNVPRIYECHPSQILFFYFNFGSNEARSIEVRNLFTYAIKKAQENNRLHQSYSYSAESQMIPEGFQGRLPSVHFGYEPSVGLLKKIKVNILNSFKEFGPLLDNLKNAFSEMGIVVEFTFSNSPNFNQGEIAAAYMFVGNPLDSSGSWSFLTGAPHGVLSPWVSEFKNEYERAFKHGSIESRKDQLLLLHQKVLEQKLAVPFLIGKQRYFLSDRVNAERWNAFDSRLRLYDLDVR